MAEKKKGFVLADALAGVSNLDTAVPGREQIEYIDPAYIKPDERNFYALDGIKELAANIEFAGLQQPIRLRPDPDAEGSYVILSGHRRFAALEQLRKEDPQRWALYPCIVERESAGGEAAAALQELKLIYANSDTRKMSSADLAKQAERVEMLLYELKEAGVEFPGRMRDHVAEACKVSKSKLARLKVIRENLIKELKKDWEKGNLSESVAYAFAKETPEVQRLTILSITRFGAVNENRKWWQEWRVKKDADQIRKELRSRKGPKGSCESCDATQQRLKRIIGSSEWDDHCGYGKCCHCCPNIGSCDFVCSHLSGEVAKAKVAALDRKRTEQEKKQKENAKQVAPTVRLWKRFGEARERAGLTFEEYAKKADACGFIREKKVADFEQGRNITPSSGGLPYAGGNGVDEWRIRPLIKAADALGVSLDYLLCRTDDPNPVPKLDTAPTWCAGTPPQAGKYYCRLNCGGAQLHEILAWDAEANLWRLGALGAGVDAEVLAWYPLPSADTEMKMDKGE